ncbi:MAG: Crp/Fnr family transcriptional regulator [Beijerinckiaceae bacterium]
MADAITTASLSASLKRTDLFRSASETAIAALTSAAIPRTWATGEQVFAAGDPSDGLYLVADGLIRLTLLTEAGSELTVRDAGAGDLFGEIGAIDASPRTATASVASRGATTAFLPAERLSEILRQHPDLLLDIARKLCRRLRETTEQLEGIALYPLRQRVARYILARGSETGRDRGGGKRSVSIALSQSELGAVLGASRPKINAALVELERSGCIERRGALIYYDAAAIASEAGVRADAQN